MRHSVASLLLVCVTCHRGVIGGLVLQFHSAALAAPAVCPRGPIGVHSPPVCTRMRFGVARGPRDLSEGPSDVRVECREEERGGTGH